MTAAITGSRVIPTNVNCINSERSIYRATISSRDIRINILTNAKTLRDHNEFKDIYINKDLTYQQRQEARRRRMDMRGVQAPPGAQAPFNRLLSDANRTPIQLPSNQQDQPAASRATRSQTLLNTTAPLAPTRSRGRGF